MNIRVCTAGDVSLLAQLNRQLIEDEHSDNAMTLPELEALSYDLFTKGFL